MTRIVRLYTGFQFFFGLLIWTPIFYEYQKRMGLSESDIFEIQSLYQIVFCFLEIPTGYFADRFGYRASLRVGAVTLVAANLLPIFAVDYAGFLAHFCLIALARSFISGASSAYLYETLRSRGEASSYKEIEGAARAYSLIGKIVCWAGVGVMMSWHLALPYWLTSAASLVSLGFAFALPPLLAAPTGANRASSLALMGEAFAAIGRKPLLLILMLQGVAIFVLARISQVTLFQPILTDKGLPLEVHGLVMSAMTAFEAFGSWRPQWVRRYIPDLHLVTWLTIGLALTLGLIPWLGPWSAVICLCVHSLAIGWSFPVQKQVMNDAIPDSRFRATLLSIESIVDRGASALITLLLARYMVTGELNGFLHDIAIATIVGILLIGWLAQRLHRRAS